VTVHCAPGQERMAEDVLAALARISQSAPVGAGTRITFGWSALTLRDDVGGGLVVCEPDFSADPTHQTRDRLDTTLDVLAKQAAFARRVSVTPVDVRFDQYVVVAHGALGSKHSQLFRSSEASGDDSGWTMTADGPSANVDEFNAIQVYEFLARRPGVLPVLVLPRGFAVLFDGDVPTNVLDAHGNERLVHA
jgi:hypothetical protein